MRAATRQAEGRTCAEGGARTCMPSAGRAQKRARPCCHWPRLLSLDKSLVMAGSVRASLPIAGRSM